ncbi:MAG: carboxypeptidase-like regulatory domain-containing protein, partial [Alicyclobacillus sp.]|nr:carboxypeptidase-like regulatory domain-containing protein [Alicyclobacillus sp.]
VIPTARLRIRVIDGRTLQPLPGAEVVLIETEQRVTTGKDGITPWFDGPVLRDPRYRPMVAELHGQLGVIVYKNGYRDSIHLGIRMHEGQETEETVWMYKLGPGDRRIEPVLYQVPYHHLWLVELADKFRSKTQPGEGPERP